MQFLDHYGYFGLFVLLLLGIVGIPLPDEALLSLVGIAIHKGHMNFWGSLTAAWLGSICGISLSYVIGRVVGRGVVTRFGRFLHLTEERLFKVERYMERFGWMMIFFGYFVPGLRHVTALTAGVTRMKYRIFAPFAYAGALFWALTFLLLGQYVSHRLHRIEEIVYPFRYWIIVLVVLSLIAPFVYRVIRKRRLAKLTFQDVPPESKE
ncbi:DedA family protein [Tumebacillus permanentifrigoris]|uniref:Membrane protein DedA with SNARE-associated domain n=1 Tax=Tumebacillus permanentifrigoris TaxID=378543 RepID=A0A316D8W8_9BACL|nr:DedA family protein [Tumebacillus permanentifrigoris]PWK07462.1 membrane protein DedA with SNARE-associated domain [Tumebacillus permanentifrigoris]